MRARIVKNKVAAPFRVAEFDIMFNQGISRMGDLLEIGANKGIIKKSGAFYSYGETRLGQGRENAKEFLQQHPEIAASVENRIRANSNIVTEIPEPELEEGRRPGGLRRRPPPSTARNRRPPTSVPPRLACPVGPAPAGQAPAANGASYA